MKLFQKRKTTSHKIYTLFGIRIKMRKNDFASKYVSKGDMYFSDVLQITYEKQKLQNNKQKIENIVIGSSHGRYSVISDDKTSNLSFGSQDLYYSFKLYEKYAKTLPNLKNIILFYSIFSPGNDLEKSPLKRRCAEYKVFFDIDYKRKNFLNEDIAGFEDVLSKVYSRSAERYKLKDLSYIDIRKKENAINLEQSKTYISSWLSLNNAKEKQDSYMKKINDLAKKYDHKLFVVLSPYSKDIREHLPKSGKLFSEVNRFAKMNEIALINLYDYNGLRSSNFYDSDHLNKSGAQKVTEIIFKKIEECINV